MTASTNPDDNSYTPKDADSRQPMGFVYDDSSAPPTEPEPNYVPEREFVLMPLFRRIGELLGIRRQPEPEYIAETAPEPQRAEASLVHEGANFGRDTSHAHEEPGFAFAPEAEPVRESAHEWAEPQPNALPDTEPTASEHIALQGPIDSSPQLPLQESEETEVSPIHFEPPSLEPTPLHVAEAELVEAPPKPHEEFEVPTRDFEQPHHGPFAEAQAPSQPAEPEVVATRSTKQAQPQAQRTAPPRRKDEIDEAIAVLREAGSKVSAAISQAVEWLSAKEEELVRKAERSLAPAPKTRRVQSSVAAPRQPVQASQPANEPASTPAIATESPSVPKWEALQFPALQREVSWTGQVAPSPTERRAPISQPAGQATSSVKPRPTLVRRRPQVPFWKRIDWAAEFTPKRVAVLGGVVMAMLIVAGVTFARRPASEVLPPQTHTIQPGGVTVTAHPTSPTAAPPAAQSRRTAPPAKRAVAPAPRRAPRADAYEEPDVVTHNYKQKPSPSKQSTVAGVKHYSDMD